MLKKRKKRESKGNGGLVSCEENVLESGVEWSGAGERWW
jgi:hypothetical protein